MTSDSHLFRTREQLERAGAKPLDKRGLRWYLESDADVDGVRVEKGMYLPLYEGKNIMNFDIGYGELRYWINKNDGEKELQRIGNFPPTNYYRFVQRRIARSTDEKTTIGTILTKNVFCSESIPFASDSNEKLEYVYALFLTSVYNSFSLDYVLRQKVSANINMFYLYQLPIPRLTSGNWFFEQIVPRAARLICVGEEFAELWEETFRPEWREIARTSKVGGWENLTEEWRPECGVYGWVEIGGEKKEKRDDGDRAQLRAEIDALVAHLYGLTKEEFAYILDTFPVLRRKEEEAFGEYRTKRMCLEEYERIGKIIDKEKPYKPEMFDLTKYKKK